MVSVISHSCKVRDGVSDGVITGHSCKVRDGVSDDVVSQSCEVRME